MNTRTAIAWLLLANMLLSGMAIAGGVEQRLTQSAKSGEQITWWVMGAGGERGTSTNFILFGTAGQTAIGQGTSPSFQITQGFWQNFAAPCQCGDANGDKTIDISDAVYLIAYIFSGGSAPGSCSHPFGMGDANADGAVDISDAVYLIAYIFSGGPSPHCP
jgi:hypothetical protein